MLLANVICLILLHVVLGQNVFYVNKSPNLPNQGQMLVVDDMNCEAYWRTKKPFPYCQCRGRYGNVLVIYPWFCVEPDKPESVVAFEQQKAAGKSPPPKPKISDEAKVDETRRRNLARRRTNTKQTMFKSKRTKSQLPL